jgi:hypothetical protein
MESFYNRQTVREGTFCGPLMAELAGGFVESSHQQVSLCDPTSRSGAMWKVTPLLVGGVKRSLQWTTTEGRTVGHQMWYYQSTRKLGKEFSD